MISKTLIKLIDQAIVPAITLLCTKVISVLLLSKYFGIPLSIERTGFVFPSRDSYILVNSYSTLCMTIVLALGLLYILVKALLFHNTHITPRLTAKLFSLRLSSFIQSSYELYSQGIVWLAYTYLIATVSGVFAAFGLIFTWVFYLSLVISIISTAVLVLDVENEMFTSKENNYLDDSA